jgi:SAM-dependent methyltransferase
LANRFLRKNQLGEPEPKYQLDVYFCPRCFLVQLGEVVSPETLFRDYVYVSGTSNTLRNHFQGLATQVEEFAKLKQSSLVVDIGSNDGTLLRCFQKIGTRTIGIEPATNIARISQEHQIETINDFFSKDVALGISKEKKASVVLATNVFAHVDDLNDFVQGVSLLLEDNGVFVIEVPYLADLLQKMLFDTIYHEHLSYFGVAPLVTLFNEFGMRIVDVKRIDSHGGSIRVYVTKSSSDLERKESVDLILRVEKEIGLSSLQTFLNFGSQVNVLKGKLLSMLKQFKAEGKRMVGYGAPAKGNTLLNCCNIGGDLLDYIVDESPLKHGLYTPGTHIEVIPTKYLREDKPDYALLLAWNYASEILEREQEFRRKGGKFIVPIPEPKVVSA